MTDTEIRAKLKGSKSSYRKGSLVIKRIGQHRMYLNLKPGKEEVYPPVQKVQATVDLLV